MADICVGLVIEYNNELDCIGAIWSCLEFLRAARSGLGLLSMAVITYGTLLI